MSQSSRRLKLTRLSSDRELDLAFRWRNDPRVYQWCRQNDILHYRDHEDWFDRQRTDKTMSMYFIWEDEDSVPRPLGVCGLTSIDHVNSRAEFSLYIDPEMQGCGFGEAALRALLNKAFFTYNLNLVWGESFTGNPAMNMFRRIGFKDEGVRRAYYFRDGKYVDAHLFSILRSEYVASYRDRSASDSYDRVVTLPVSPFPAG